MKLVASESENSFRYLYLLKRIYKYIRPVLPRALVGFLVAIPVGMLDGVMTFVLKPFMDIVIGQKNMLMAVLIPFGVIIFALVQGVLKYLNGYLTDWTSQKVTNSIKIDLFKKLISMNTKFYDDNSSGIILSRYMGDPDTASRGIIDNLKMIITSVCGASALIAVMLYNSWKLAIVGVVVMCTAFLPVILIRKRIKKASNANIVIGGSITTNCNETYIGNRIIASYNLQEQQREKFETRIWESFAINMSLIKRTAWLSPMMNTIASIGVAVVLWYGTHLIITGQMTAGGFTSFVVSLLLLYKPIKSIGDNLIGLQNIFVAVARVFELFDIDSEIQEKPDALECQGLTQGISIENVSFQYEEDKPVLKNINLYVASNETLAVVGNSGGGKTTLVNLIPRFYDVNSGSIKLDGVDIRDFKLESLRDNIAVVFQDNFLFSGTIRENILMGNKSASDEELQAALSAAHLDELIASLPDGVDSYIGERGTTLSGGQRQRLAIARAMIKNAPIVILDEATSALDNKSEEIVQKAIDNLMQNKTVFVIAHRLSTIKNANRIAVINDGQLVELGRHEELMQNEDGIYKNLYMTQFRKEEAAV